MSNDHDTQTDAPVPQFEPADDNHDGAQDRVRLMIDRNGDKIVDDDLDSPVFHAGGYEWFRGKRVAPDPQAPSLEQAARAEGFFERAGKRVDGALLAWKLATATSGVVLLASVFYIVGIWNGLFSVGVVAPPAPASQGAVYRLLRDARDSRSDLWLVIVADEDDAARVEAAMAKDEGGER